MNHFKYEYKFMRFYQIKTPINFQYTLSNSNTELVSQFKDFGIFDT